MQKVHNRRIAGINLKRVFCEKEKRKISKELSIQYKGKGHLIEGKRIKYRLVGETTLVMELFGQVHIEISGIEL